MSDTIIPTNICRICLEEESNIDMLINPCKCDGTSKYVHKTCINTWFDETSNPDARKMCMACKTPYIFQNYHIPEKYKLLFIDTLKSCSTPKEPLIPTLPENCDPVK